MDIELQTEGGDFVAVVEIPPFQRLPAVVVWGVRTFTLHTAGERPADGALPVYREAFAYLSTTPAPGKQRAGSCRTCGEMGWPAPQTSRAELTTKCSGSLNFVPSDASNSRASNSVRNTAAISPSLC